MMDNKYKYKLGIHGRGGSYEEHVIHTLVPVSNGDYVSLECGGDEYEVKQIVHYDEDCSIIHVDDF